MVELRRKRLTQARIAVALGLSKSTVGRVLARAGLSRLSDLQPAEPVVRYEHAAPGDMLHIDTKKLGRIVRPSYRVTGNRKDSVTGAGWEMLFVAIDDHARIAFTDIQKESSSGVCNSCRPTTTQHRSATVVSCSRSLGMGNSTVLPESCVTHSGALLMHFDDQDAYIRRNLVALSFGVMLVAFLRIPAGVILQNILRLDAPVEQWKLSLIGFSAFGYLIWRLKTSAAGRSFRRLTRRQKRELMIYLFERDYDRWINSYVRGKPEPWRAKGCISEQLTNIWERNGKAPDTQRYSRASASLRMVDSRSFPNLVFMKATIRSGRFTNAFETPEDGVDFSVKPPMRHIMLLSLRTRFFVHFSHRIGMDVTVPLLLTAGAQGCLFGQVWRAYSSV